MFFEKILLKLKLIEFLTVEIEMPKSEFVLKLSKRVDAGSFCFLLSPFILFDIFSSSSNELKGQVNNDNFKIRKKRNLLDSHIHTAYAKGTYQELNGKLKIEAKIIGVSGFYYVFTLLFLLSYLIMLPLILIIALIDGSEDFFTILIILIISLLFLVIPYFFISGSIKQLKQELERQIHYIINE